MNSTTHNILLVDDDVELVAMLKEYLEQEGFDVAAVHDGERGVAEALSGAYQLMVLDVMMPRMSGVDALRKIRAESAIPVIMLTARGDDTDRIIGLELGADDYVPKPCTPRELVARVRAILRRAKPLAETEGNSALIVGKLTVMPEQRRVEWNGQVIDSPAPNSTCWSY